VRKVAPLHFFRATGQRRDRGIMHAFLALAGVLARREWSLDDTRAFIERSTSVFGRPILILGSSGVPRCSEPILAVLVPDLPAPTFGRISHSLPLILRTYSKWDDLASSPANTVSRSGTGQYKVQFVNHSMAFGDVQVTAYGFGSQYCKVAFWNSFRLRTAEDD